MDDYSVGTALADEFDVANKLAYSASSEALVRSSNSSITTPLSNHFDPEADHIVLVTLEKDKRTLGTQKAFVAALFQNWGVPKVATGHLFDAREPQGFFAVAGGPVRCCWYHIPVVRFSGNFEYGVLHVWQVLDANTLHWRVLVLYPPFMKADMIAVLPSFFSHTSGNDDLQWTEIHLILMRVAIATWEGARWAVMSLGAISLRGMAVAIDKALDDGPIKSCNESLSRLNLTINKVLQLKALTEAVCQYMERELPSLDAKTAHPARTYIHNYQNGIDFLWDSYKFLHEQLLLTRHTLTTSIEIKNASYMRANTIALRRIAEQNQTEAQRTKKQAELSQKNSHSMTRIAYVTMFYLPATFVATLFSMPFLALDDRQKFSNLGQIWIYAVASVASTAVTFLMSMASSKFPTGLGHQSIATSGEDELSNNDTQVLEPQHHIPPRREELVQQVIAALNRGDNDDAVARPSTAELEDSESSDTNRTER